MIWLAAAHAAPCPATIEAGRIVPAAGELAFTSGKATLTETSEPVLDAVSCLVAADDALTVQVEVYTDTRGSEVWNLKLSQDRADAVRAALIARGAPEGRVTAVGYGETGGGVRRVELRTEPPSERPPRPVAPEPVPSPAPAPAPVVDVCAAARVAPDATPVVLPHPFEAVAACFPDGSRDGDELYVDVRGAVLLYAPEGSGTRVRRR